MVAFNYIVLLNSNVAPLPQLPFNFQVLLRHKKGSRRLYDILIQSKKSCKEVCGNWERKLQINYDSTKWSCVPFTCTVDSKLKWFQFRVTHRTLGTNSFLFKVNKKDPMYVPFARLKTNLSFIFFVNVVM